MDNIQKQLEKLTDWCWENKGRFCGVLGGLAVLGFGVGVVKEPTAVQRALEMADNNLIEVGDA